MARRLATAVAYGSGGVGVIGASTLGVLAVEGLLARRSVGPPAADPPEAAGTYVAHDAADAEAAPLSLLMLGDSSAAGLGATAAVEVPGAQLALGVSAIAQRPVRLHSLAVVGARSQDLADQVSAGLCQEPSPDVAVVIIGANDVTHLNRPIQSAQYLVDAIRRFRAAGAAVVVGTCPDLGTIDVIPQPLRALAAARGRQLAAAQTVAAVEAGARAVSLGDLLGPQFAERPKEMFSKDRFHPSPVGYAVAAAALLPSVVGALGLGPGAGRPAELAELAERRPDDVLPVHVAAAEAARDPGTEVMRGQIAGRDRGPRGRFAAMRHRRAT